MENTRTYYRTVKADIFKIDINSQGQKVSQRSLGVWYEIDWKVFFLYAENTPLHKRLYNGEFFTMIRKGL